MGQSEFASTIRFSPFFTALPARAGRRRAGWLVLALLLTLTLPGWAATISGRVFEDPNYGGGAGRAYLTADAGAVASGFAAGAVGRSGARVELFQGNTFRAFTTTAVGGTYAFVVLAGTYTVRVVNTSVTSARAGAAPFIAVQTFVNGDVNRVGGEVPSKVDAGNAATINSTLLTSLTTATATPQSITTLTVGAADVVTDVDFGFCFDVVVNVNTIGQGSLKQFSVNANALGSEALLAQAGQTQVTTSATPAALPAGRETSIFMISDGAAHPGLRVGLPSLLTTQNGQQVAIITLGPTNARCLAFVGTNAPLTTLDGGTQTVNVGNLNAANLHSGGAVGINHTLSFTGFSGPEVQLTGTFSGGVKPTFAMVVQNNDITVRNLAMRNFLSDIYIFRLVPMTFGPLAGYPLNGGVGLLGPTNLVVEYCVLGTDASSFTAPTPFSTAEGANGRSNQHLLTGTSGGTNVSIKTFTVRTSLLGFSERRGIHVQGNLALDAGYNLNMSIYDNVFEQAGVQGPYTSSSAGGVELILTTQPFVEIYDNLITGPSTIGSLFGQGSDGIQFNNASVGVTPEGARRDAGGARPGSRVEQNTITNQRAAVLCQSNGTHTAFALDNLAFAANRFTGNIYGFFNTGAGHVFSDNQFDSNSLRGGVSIGPNVTFTSNTFSTNGTDGLVIGDPTIGASTATKPAVTGVVLTQNTFSGNGPLVAGVGVVIVNTDTRAVLSRNSMSANGALSIDLNNNNTSNYDGVTANNGTLTATFPNREVDYPLFTLAERQMNGNLKVTGYVGSAPGQSTFAGARVEIFLADNTPANQNGESVGGDASSVGHGESATFLGFVTADASGNFSSIFVPAVPVAGGQLVTATATLGTAGSATAGTSELGTNFPITQEVVLPVELISFRATPRGTAVQLTWATASERNSATFSVERSADGRTFAEVGTVGAAGTSAARHAYEMLDARPLAGRSYYRLRQTDRDGATAYSTLQTVRMGTAANAAASLYPTATTGEATLDLRGLPAGTCTVTVLDLSGRTVAAPYQLPAGGTYLLGANLRPGTYQVQVLTATGGRQTLPLVRE